jgi:hypothetical protein
MFATVRESTFAPYKRRRGRAQLAEFAARLARQPGYAGVVGVDARDGRTLTVALWESEAPDAERLLVPFWSTPARVIAQGPVLRTDLAKR